MKNIDGNIEFQRSIADMQEHELNWLDETYDAPIVEEKVRKKKAKKKKKAKDTEISNAVSLSAEGIEGGRSYEEKRAVGKRRNRAEDESTEKLRLNKKGQPTIFQPFTVKDIVFLAIIGAAALCTSGVMALVQAVPIFGLPQVVVGLQMSIFPAVGIMKVRKHGSIFIVGLLVALFELFMAQTMAIATIISVVVVELILMVLFRTFKRDIGCFIGAALVNPLTLPFYYLACRWIDPTSSFYVGANERPWIAVGISLAVIAICVVGAGLGVMVSRELRKAGVLRK